MGRVSVPVCLRDSFPEVGIRNGSGLVQGRWTVFRKFTSFYFDIYQIYPSSEKNFSAFL